MMTRVCSKCGIEQDASEFYSHPSITTRDHVSKQCRSCVRAYQKEYRKTHYVNRYVKVDPTKDKRRDPEHIAKRKKRTPQKARAGWTVGLSEDDIPLSGTPRYRLGRRIWGSHRATLVWYESRAAAGCGICGKQGRLELDHDHSCCTVSPTCGKCNRGLLCRGCNSRLSYLERGYDYSAELPEWQLKATQYLR